MPILRWSWSSHAGNGVDIGDEVTDDRDDATDAENRFSTMVSRECLSMRRGIHSSAFRKVCCLRLVEAPSAGRAGVPSGYGLGVEWANLGHEGLQGKGLANGHLLQSCSHAGHVDG